jgi:hypothetical protein
MFPLFYVAGLVWVYLRSGGGFLTRLCGEKFCRRAEEVCCVRAAERGGGVLRKRNASSAAWRWADEKSRNRAFLLASGAAAWGVQRWGGGAVGGTTTGRSAWAPTLNATD